jgi:hypothetical protein
VSEATWTETRISVKVEAPPKNIHDCMRDSELTRISERSMLTLKVTDANCEIVTDSTMVSIGEKENRTFGAYRVWVGAALARSDRVSPGAKVAEGLKGCVLSKDSEGKSWEAVKGPEQLSEDAFSVCASPFEPFHTELPAVPDSGAFSVCASPFERFHTALTALVD